MSIPRFLLPFAATSRLTFTTAVRASCRPRTIRCLVTATPYRPEHLEIPPTEAAPRNKDAPHVPRVEETRDPATLKGTGPSNSTVSMSTTTASTQTQTQTQTIVTTPTPVAQPTTTPTPAPRMKLRARKAALTLTPLAISHLRNLLTSPDPKLIRVGVKNRGCSGLAYHLEYVDKPGRFDEEVVQEGVKVLIDSKALFSIIGSEMDWVEDQLSARFVFRNPNIKEQCGCGESFMV